MRFTELVRAFNDMDPGKAQAMRHSHFRDLIANTHLSLWEPGDPVPVAQTRILMGTAPWWNLYDAVLLDLIEERLADGSVADLCVQVFDLDACKSPEGVGEYVPGLVPYSQPVVGIWEDGRLTHASYGWSALLLMFERFGMPQTRFYKEVKREFPWHHAARSRQSRVRRTLRAFVSSW